MNIPQAVERIGVSRRTIERWLHTGQLRSTLVLGDKGQCRREISIEALIEADDQRNRHSLAGAVRKRAA